MENELVTFPNVQMTKTHLIIPEETSFDDWEDIGKKLKTVEGAVQFWIGDWINFGERKYEDKYLRAMAETGYTYEYLKNIAYVSRKFNGNDNGHSGVTIEGLATRHENLGFSFHQITAPLAGPIAERFLNKAEEEHLTKRELEADVREWQMEHQPKKETKRPEVVFSWFHDPDIEAMLDGMQNIRTGVNKLTRDQRDPEVRKDLLQKVDVLMVGIDKDIKKYLGGLK